MGRKIKVPVNPVLVKYARESVGLTLEDAEAVTKIELKRLEDFENDKDCPSITEIKKLCIAYHRAIPFFLLPQIPKEKPLPKEFRTFSSEKGIVFTYESWLAFRRALDLQSIAVELSQNLKYKNKITLKHCTLASNPEKEAKNLRQLIGLSFKIQKAWQNSYQAYSELRSVVESLGVLTAQESFPVNEARGFALNDAEYPLIVINSKDSINGRIFTLFHELAHILLDRNGIFFNNETTEVDSKHKSIEQFCNHFAGAFLVPTDDLSTHPLVKTNQGNWEDTTLDRIAGHFKTSRETILRRLVILKLATPHFYEKKKKEWQEQFRNRLPQPKPQFKANPPKDCIRNNGRKLVSLGIENYNLGYIAPNDFSSYFKVPGKHLSAIESYIYS